MNTIEIITIIITLGLSFLGTLVTISKIWLTNIWVEIKDLRMSQAKNSTRISEVELVVANNYLKKSDFDKSIQMLHAKLESIDSKVGGAR